MAKKSSRAKKAQAVKIPDEQWTRPVSFSADGTPVSLQDFLQPKAPALSLSELSADQRAELTAKRIELQPKFELAMVGAGIVDKERAIREVKEQTGVGRALIEI